ncbi:kinesin-like protein KIF28 [Sycon ciliatum]|uniref:kinesin-like protein KIF28 n=1 Tax=Sycon ciliatum TaxID=27933 RepID=UPI0020AC503D|eukprot:scpid14606/ scgid20426/ Kinesin-like protein KLP6; Kinesin-like protein 6
MSESVKVAVRVRPFNQREKQRNAKLIIDMNGATTYIQNPDNPSQPAHKFTFDFSYWSHDGYSETEDGVLEPDTDKYASQRRVFDDLGQGVLDNAFKGFNCSLFAYGQTGSGKSYSMVGYGANRGIVPITCDELFKKIMSSEETGVRYEITFSMLEIYNEQVRDLLSKKNPKGGLKIRQNPSQGMFYVPDLRKVPVASYEEIEKRMSEGTNNRTVASTNMNATSSRAHTVVTVVFSQVYGEAGDASARKKTSVINLVDLAGSERADSTGATGDRLKEGANINQSLSTLGKVISLLAEGQKTIPYRESALTKLLKNALGGNSKTVMIAALSPADINHDETLGTLRYADRAKQIKTKATVNENPLDKLIRELKAENEKLKAQLGPGGPSQPISSAIDPEAEQRLRAEIENEMREKLLANQYQLREANTDFEDQLRNARAEISDEEERLLQVKRKRQLVPHFLNLNADLQLSRVVEHFLPEGKTVVSRLSRNRSPAAVQDENEWSEEILLEGISILHNHCQLENKENEVCLTALAANADTKVNGTPLVGCRVLMHNDRVVFGTNHYMVFINPMNMSMSANSPDLVDWQYAQQEIAEQRGLVVKSGEHILSKEEQVFHDQVVDLLPMVNEVNAISEELNKYKTFEIVVVPVEATYGKKKRDATTLPVVMMRDLLNGNCWLWQYGTFLNRRYMIQELYQRWVDGEVMDAQTIPQEDDPFWEPPEPILVGTACVYLQSLAYGMDFQDKLALSDYHNVEQGSIAVAVEPCNADSSALDDDFFVEDPDQLMGKPFHFKVCVDQVSVTKQRFSLGLHVEYRVYGEDTSITTHTVHDTLDAKFDHSHQVSLDVLDKEHLHYFDDGCIMFHVYAHQSNLPPDLGKSLMTTTELRKAERMQMQYGSSSNEARPFTAVTHRSQEYLQQMRSELVVLRSRVNLLSRKEKRIQTLVEQWAMKPKTEQSFRPFHRAVNAAVFSTGSRLRTIAKTVGATLQVQKFTSEKSRGSVSDISDHEREESGTAAAVASTSESPLSADASAGSDVAGFSPTRSASTSRMTAADVQNIDKGATQQQQAASPPPRKVQSSQVCVLQ